MADRLADREQYVLELEAELNRLRAEVNILKEENHELQSLKEVFAVAFDNHPIPMAITTLEGGFYEAVNRSYAENLGFRKEDMIGKTSLELGLWIDPKAGEEIGRQLIEKGLAACFESEHRSRDGRSGTALTFFNIIDIGGKGYVVTSVADITARKKSEEKFTKIFYNSQTGLVITKRDTGIYVDVNDYFLKVFGYSRGEVIGRSAVELGIWSDPTDRGSNIDVVSREGGVRDKECLMKTKSGDLICCLSSVSSIDIEGEPHLLVSFVDITQRKQAEATLAQSQALCHKVFDSIPMAIILVSADGQKVVEVNKAFVTRNNLTRNDLIGQVKNRPNIFGKPEQMQAYFETVRRDGEAHNVEIQYYAPSGEIRTVLISGTLIDWEGEECILSVSNDITKLRNYENQIKKLDNLSLMGQMAGSIAHEVRNPMTSVKGFLQLFHGQYKYREDRDAIELMIEELDRVNDIISSFLSLAKKNTIDVKLQDLNEKIQSILPLIMSDAIKFDVYLDTDFGHLPAIMFDEGEIRQLLLNLTRNGIQAMPSGGMLSIKTFENEKGVNLVVQDQGQGIPPEMIDKIWAPFVTTKKNGTGLGMAVCRSIAEGHNASISFDTTPQGTAFQVTFPVYLY